MILKAILGLFGGYAENKVAQYERAKGMAKAGVGATEVNREEYLSAKLKPGQAVYTVASPVKEITPSDFVATMKIMAAKDVELGTMILYLYKREGVVKRVFKIRDNQVKELLRAKKPRYYMTNLTWDKDDTNLVAAKRKSCEDLERLLTLCSVKPKPEKVQAATAETLEKTPKETVIKKVETVVAASELRDAVARQAKGETQIGVVAEMGMVDRSGRSGTYRSFCLKIDSNGTIKPSYGVELEREARERNVRAGDTIKLVFMGTEKTLNGHKNLYRIEVLKKGA
ncbi:hypothetical protein [Diaphorobacter sp. LR2014-1]|uniref:hypothetical protein n=1 Tax=Diaphorobacter sp. LR2014-1 TaxID=1933219 RepID=UPI000CDB112D|nr:hypothetical protein [Diaphorobacter sp. LR2014-1]POR10850.1 hypothetical protein BV908_08975 [Diaphorobacter sp. LR2014-1]